MIRAFNYAAILVMLGVFSVPCANAAEHSAEYLQGRWVVGDQNCSSPNSEYMEFDKDGTFKGTRLGKPETVGFWNLDDGIIKLHILTSPVFFQDLNKDLAKFEGLYSSFRGNMVIFNVKDNNFEAFGTIGEEIQKTTAVRCP